MRILSAIGILIIFIQINLIDAIRLEYQANMLDETDDMKIITENSHAKKNKLQNTLNIRQNSPEKEYFDQSQIFNYFAQSKSLKKQDSDEESEKDEESEDSSSTGDEKNEDEESEEEDGENEEQKEKKSSKKHKQKEEEKQKEQNPQQKQVIIPMKDSDSSIIQKEDGEIYFIRYDPVTKTTQMMNMNKIKDVDFSKSKLTIDTSIETSDKPLKDKYTVPTYEPFEWYQVLSEGEIPQRRGGHSISVVGQYVILFGGCLLDIECFNDLYFYDIVEKSWQRPKVFGEPPSPRGGHSATLVGSYLYIFGGSSDHGTLNDLHRLNLQDRLWEQFEYEGPKPPGRNNHKAVLDNNGRIVFFGGYTDQGYSNDVYFLDLVNMRWVKPLVNGEAPHPRENFSMNLIRDSYIWIFGGYALGGETNDLWQLDVDNMKWSRILQNFGTKPVERQGHQMILHGKLLYTLGGCNYKETRCFNDVYQLNIDDLTWTKLDFVLENVLKERDNYGFSLMGSDLYVFGGCQMMEKCFNDFFVMNINDICPKNCSDRGTCRNNRCQCKEGYFGEQCEIEMKCEYNCSNRGICGTDGNCKCYRGFAGRICEVYVPCPSNCTSIENGLCENNGTCLCNHGYSGSACEIGEKGLTRISIKCLNKCSGHGTCNEETGLCICEPGYGDVDCSLTLEMKEKKDLEKKKKEEEEKKKKEEEEKAKKAAENKTGDQSAENQPQANEQANNGSEQPKDDQQTQTEHSVEKEKTEETTIKISENSDTTEITEKTEVTEESTEVSSESQSQEVVSEEEQSQPSESNIVLSKSEEIAKLIHMSLKAQEDKQNSESLSECENNCSFNGICVDKECFCKPGVTGSDCSASKISHLHKGVKATKLFFYIPIFFIIGLIIGFLYLKQNAIKEEKQEFGDILEYEEEQKRQSILALHQNTIENDQKPRFVEDLSESENSLVEIQAKDQSYDGSSVNSLSHHDEEHQAAPQQQNILIKQPNQNDTLNQSLINQDE